MLSYYRFYQIQDSSIRVKGITYLNANNDTTVLRCSTDDDAFAIWALE